MAMHNSQPEPDRFVDPSRLISAADAILWAVQTLGLEAVRLPPDPQSAVMSGYTSSELEQAAMFLARLGVVELVWINEQGPDGDES